MFRSIYQKYQLWWLLSLVISLAILMRTLHYPLSFNFSSDQAAFSITAYTQLKNSELALQGPPFSFKIGDKQVAQGPAIYYLQTLFLLLGNFDPLYASLAFTLFSCLMMIPLYIGTKLLFGDKAAWILVIIYALNPFYITYTKFLWNPNYQLSLLPWLFLLMGLYKKNPSGKIFFLLGFVTFLLLQLHYQFFIGLIGIITYYLIRKTNPLHWGLFILGGVLAYLPYLYYEITHKFYNLDTLWFFMTHRDILYSQNQDQSSLAPHYYLSLSFLAIFLMVGLVRKYLTKQIIIVTFLSLLGISGYYFIPMPKGAYGMAEDWNYQNEAKVHQILKEQQLDSFNLTNLEYDSLYHVQKYLLLKSGIEIETGNYYDNKYLFVVSPTPEIFSYPAYEIQSFQPSREIAKWPINEKYTLYLLERS